MPERISALDDIDENEVEVVLTDSDSKEDDDDSDVLEEGEFVPDLDWNQIFQMPYGFAEDYVQPYLQDPGLANKEQHEIDRQVFLAERLYVPSPRMINFKVFTRVGDTQDVFALSWDIDDSKDFNVNEYPVPDRNEDHFHVVDKVIPATHLLREQLKPSLFWDFVMDKDARTYTTVTLSWFYESELKLFVIKRKDGCQYLTPMQKHC